MRQFFLSVFLLIVFAPALFSQQVKGKISSNNGEPLQGISVLLRGTYQGTSTNEDGQYQLNFPKPGTYILDFQGVGFIPAEKAVAVGQETLELDLVMEPSISTLKDVTITASRKAEIVDRTPASVQVINSREIQTQLQLSPNINNILANAVPSLGFGNNTTSNTGQTLRGRNPLILIDGIPQSTPLRSGGRDMRTIDPAIIDRIEVVKGATAIYGNGADGGIINYITRKPLKGEKFKASTYLSNTGMLAHSDDTYGFRATQQISGNAGQFDYIANGTFEKTGVHKDANGEVLTPVYGLGETNIYNFFGKAGYNFTPKQRIEAMYNYFGSKQNSDYIESMGTYMEKPTTGIPGKTQGVDEGTRFNHNAYLRYQAKDLYLGTTLDASVYLQRFYTVYGFSSFFQNGGQSTIESDKTGGRLNLNTPFQKESWLTGDIGYGVDVMNDITSQKLTDGRIWVPEMDMKNIAPYIQASATIKNNWILKGGYRYDAVNLDIPDFTQILDSRGNGGQEIKGAELSFSASTFNTGLRYAKWEKFKPFVSYTQGFSLIDVGRFVRAAKENDIEKMQIEPVVVHNYEAGFSSNFGWLSFTGSYFISKNKIGASLVEENGLYVQQKAPEKTYGLEAALDFSPVPQVKAGISYMYVEGKADINQDNDFDDAEDRYLTGMKIPPQKTTAYIRYSPIETLSFYAQWIHFGNRDRFEKRTNTGRYAYGEGPVEANSWINFSGNWKIDRRFSLNFGIENLLNNDFFMPQAMWSAQDGDYIKANGIRYQAGVGINW